MWPAGEFMNRQEFIQTLVTLLVTIDRGMSAFDTPLPEKVEESIKLALIGFGNEAIPILHENLSRFAPDVDLNSLIEVLGIIRNPSSTSYIIEFHKNHSSFLSGLVAMNALRKLRAEAGYLYMSELLLRQSAGDQTAFNTSAEIVVACKSLGEWDDPQAMKPLMEATRIRDIQGMPEAAIDALAKYPKAHNFLKNLAVEDPSLKELIAKVTSS